MKCLVYSKIDVTEKLIDLYVQVYVYLCVCKSYVYPPEEVDVPKPSRVHMGSVRPKMNNVAVAYTDN